MKPVIIVIAIPVLILFSGTTLGQNQLDDLGRKSGPWRAEYPDGKTLYEGYFVEGKPVGMMVRYYENGAVRARMMFDSIEERSYTTLLYKSGKPAAEGWYVNKVKDSVWTYYSEYDGTVRLTEPYKKGNVHGVAKSFYPGGSVSEEVNWVENKKDGPWKQYYEDGSLRLESSYRDDKLNGLYHVFFPDSTIKISGTFLNDVSHGIWKYYSEEGTESFSMEYQNGQPVDMDKYLEFLQDSAYFHITRQGPGDEEYLE